MNPLIWHMHIFSRTSTVPRTSDVLQNYLKYKYIYDRLKEYMLYFWCMEALPGLDWHFFFFQISISTSNHPPYPQIILIVGWWSSVPRVEAKRRIGSRIKVIIATLYLFYLCVCLIPWLIWQLLPSLLPPHPPLCLQESSPTDPNTGYPPVPPGVYTPHSIGP